MKQFVPILVLVCSGWSAAANRAQSPSAQPSNPPSQQSSADTSHSENSQSPSAGSAKTSLSIQDDNTSKAKAVIEQAIEALGGATYLNIRDREQQGRGYGFHHGRSSGNGVLFWSFSEFPDKERSEITQQRDVAQLYVGNKGWEITYKGAHPIEEKDLSAYLRRRKFSLDNILRTWVNDPGVVMLYEGNAIAAQHPAVRVTLINSKNESVTLFFDEDTHLPIKKSFEWRDPVDKQKNLEEEIYENYRAVSGIMAPYNLTRYFNGDMESQRFLNTITINQGLDETMFDPNSNYNPNKTQRKH
jgi:hypothetical protein